MIVNVQKGSLSVLNEVVLIDEGCRTRNDQSYGNIDGYCCKVNRVVIAVASSRSNRENQLESINH